MMPLRLRRLLTGCSLTLFTACATSAPSPPSTAPEPEKKPAELLQPTRTDFRTLAKKLVSRCVGGGWISAWRATQPDPDAARPRIHLEGFSDETGRGVDPAYLTGELERKMRQSRVFDMVSGTDARDFVARGKLMRLEERGAARRIPIYTALLELRPDHGGAVQSCEASVEGDLD